MRPIIALTGYAGAGKDCAAEGLTARGWERVAFADGVRELALKIDPLVTMAGGYRLAALVKEECWAGAKQNPDVRRLLQNIGTGVREVIGETVWVELAMRKVRESLAAGIVITDCRFPNEVAAVRAYGGKIVRITRPGVGPVNGHISETAIDDIEPDDWIVNDGTPQVMQQRLWSCADCGLVCDAPFGGALDINS